MATVAFIGLGNMGGPMAANLLRAGHQVRAYDLMEESLKRLQEQGAVATSSPHDAAKNADVVITMLPAGKHVADVYLGTDTTPGLLEQLSLGALVLDCSTIDTETVHKVAQVCTANGIDMLDAPVSGGVAAAKAGTLTFMCGGSPDAFVRAQPLLANMGKNIFHAGGHGAGQVAKQCNNMLLAIHMIGTSEALQMGVKCGLDPKILSDIMLNSSGRNWSLELYNPYPGIMDSPASNGYNPGFMIDLMAKDLGLATANARATGSKIPLGEKAESLFRQKQAAGDGRKDFSSILELLA